MINFLKQKDKKARAGLLVVCLLACYLFATSVTAQRAEQGSEALSSGKYTTDPLSYGDIWAFDENTHSRTNYNIGKKLEWIKTAKSAEKNNSNSDNTTSDVFVSVKITDGLLDKSSAVQLAQLSFDKFRSNVNAVTSQNDVPIVTLTNVGAAGIYSVVPNRTGTYYVHLYRADATDSTISMKYAMLDSGETTNDFSTNVFSGKLAAGEIVLSRVGGTNWYRGEVFVDHVKWSAVKLTNTMESTSASSNPNNAHKGVNGNFIGSQKQDLTLNDKDYYNNNWSKTDLFYNTVLVLQIPANTSLGPISSKSELTIRNSEFETGSLTVTTPFGESYTVEGEQNISVNMPLSLSLQGNDGAIFLGFTDKEGKPTSVYYDGILDSANTIKTITDKSEYVYYHEGTIDTEGNDKTYVLSTDWSKPITLPVVTVSGDQTEYGFLGQNVGRTTYVKGNGASFTFTLDMTGVESLASASYTVSGVIKDGQSSYGGTIDFVNTPQFTITPVFDETVVTIKATDIDGKNYSITYTFVPTVPEGDVIENKNTGKKYRYIEDALMEAGDQHTLVLLKTASFQSPEMNNGFASSNWLSNNAGYTIRRGVTLILPYDPQKLDPQGNDRKKHPYALTEYTVGTNDFADRDDNVLYTLTLQKNQTLTVNGMLIVGGAINSASGGGVACSTSNQFQHSNIAMEDGSKIIVDGSSAVLSCCGYIYNCGANKTGQVIVQNGASAYEPFVIADTYGGSFSLGAGGHAAGKDGANVHAEGWLNNTVKDGFKYSPSTGYMGNATVTDETGEAVCIFQRWAMLNIQSDLVIQEGTGDHGKLYGYLDLYAFDQHNIGLLDVISPSTETLLVLKNDAVVTRTYSDQVVTTINGRENVTIYNADSTSYEEISDIGKIGKTTLRIEGGADFGKMTMNVNVHATAMSISVDIGVLLDSVAFDFVVPYNMEVILGGNGEYGIAQDITLLPGSVLKVENGSTLTLDNGGQLVVVPYLRDHRIAAGSNHWDTVGALMDEAFVDTVSYPTKKDLEDAGYNGNAQLIIDGILKIGANGSLGGVIQTNGSGTVDATAAKQANLTTVNQLGAVGQSNLAIKPIGVDLDKNFAFHMAGASVFELTAQVYNPSTGALVDMMAGTTYSAIPCAQNQENFHYQIDSVAYTLYSNSCACETTSNAACHAMLYSTYKTNYQSKNIEHPTIKDILADNLGIVTDGGWYKYIVNAELADGITLDGEVDIAGWINPSKDNSVYNALETREKVNNIVGTTVDSTYSFTASERVRTVTVNGIVVDPDANGVYSIGEIDANTTIVMTPWFCEEGKHVDEDGNLTCDNPNCNEPLAKLVALNASADSTIELSLKFLLHDDLINGGFNATVKFGEKVLTVRQEYFTGTETVDGKTRYVYTVPVASGEMTKPVTVSFKTTQGDPIYFGVTSNEESGVETSSTVAGYARLVLEQTAPNDATAEQISMLNKQKSLVAAMLSYGGYAQAHFSADVVNFPDLADLVNAGAYFDLEGSFARPSIDGITANSIAKEIVVEDSGDLGFTATTQNVTLGAAIGQKVYITVPAGFDINNYTFKVKFLGSVKTVELQSETANDEVKYFVEIQNIPAAHLDYDYQIIITENATNNQCVIKASVLAYLKRLLASDNAADTLKDLARAMYLYNQAANEFFGV